jgi:hypothetical protein
MTSSGEVRHSSPAASGNSELVEAILEVSILLTMYSGSRGMDVQLGPPR